MSNIILMLCKSFVQKCDIFSNMGHYHNQNLETSKNGPLALDKILYYTDISEYNNFSVGPKPFCYRNFPKNYCYFHQVLLILKLTLQPFKGHKCSILFGRIT